MSGHFVKEFQDGREKRVTRVPGVPKLSGRGQSVKRLAIPNDSSQRQFGHVHWVAEFPDRDTFWNGDTCGTKALAQRLQEIQGGKTPKTKDPRPGFIKICAPAPACLARSLRAATSSALLFAHKKTRGRRSKNDGRQTLAGLTRHLLDPAEGAQVAGGSRLLQQLCRKTNKICKKINKKKTPQEIQDSIVCKY